MSATPDKPIYRAMATYDGTWWSVIFGNLPKGYAGATQGRTWKQALEMARDVVASLLDVEPDSFDLVMRPADPVIAEAIDDMERAKAEAERAQTAAALAQKRAAQLLTRTLTVRDAGALLDLSHQQVAKLAPKKKQA